MFEFARLTTLHPALVHLPLGAIPLATIAYIMASLKRSERWLFVGDVALTFSAIAIAIAAAFGFVAYFRVQWPGGLAPWPIIHLVLGVATTLGVWVLLLSRLRTQRWLKAQAQRLQRPFARAATSWNWALGSIVVMLLATVTGYIGGEILVFHGGLAVKAGADGMLAPPLSAAERSPATLLDAMHRLRALWASSVAATSRATTQHPTDAEFTRVTQNAQEMQHLARWLGEEARAQNQSEGKHTSRPDPDMARFAHTLQAEANHLEQAASRRDLPETLVALGATSSACATCHNEKRWVGQGPLAQSGRSQPLQP